MKLTVGSKVFYPCQGPCLVCAVVERVVAGEPKSFYHLVVLGDGGGELFVPVDKVQAIGIRLLAPRSDIPQLLGQLMKPAKIARHRKQRANDTLKRFTSGSAFDLAEVVESLTELSKTKELTVRENWTLARARKLLICEISEVLGEAKNAAEIRINQALESPTPRGITRVPSYLPAAAEFGQSM